MLHTLFGTFRVISDEELASENRLAKELQGSSDVADPCRWQTLPDIGTAQSTGDHRPRNSLNYLAQQVSNLMDPCT